MSWISAFMDASDSIQCLKSEADQDQNGVVSQEVARNHDALLILRHVQIPWIDDTEYGSKGSGLMHHKFIVIDGERVITGSANFTNSGMHGGAGATQTRGKLRRFGIRMFRSTLSPSNRQ